MIFFSKTNHNNLPDHLIGYKEETANTTNLKTILGDKTDRAEDFVALEEMWNKDRNLIDTDGEKCSKFGNQYTEFYATNFNPYDTIFYLKASKYQEPSLGQCFGLTQLWMAIHKHPKAADQLRVSSYDNMKKISAKVMLLQASQRTRVVFENPRYDSINTPRNLLFVHDIGVINDQNELTHLKIEPLTVDSLNDPVYSSSGITMFCKEGITQNEHETWAQEVVDKVLECRAEAFSEDGIYYQPAQYRKEYMQQEGYYNAIATKQEVIGAHALMVHVLGEYVTLFDPSAGQYEFSCHNHFKRFFKALYVLGANAIREILLPPSQCPTKATCESILKPLESGEKLTKEAKDAAQGGRITDDIVPGSGAHERELADKYFRNSEDGSYNTGLETIINRVLHTQQYGGFNTSLGVIINRVLEQGSCLTQ